MKPLKYLMLFILATAFSISTKADDIKYLEGAVPVIDGKVTYTRDFTVQGVNKKDIYDRVKTWLENHFEAAEGHSRILYTDEEKGDIAGIGQDYLVFHSNFISLDRSLLEYYVVAQCADEKCSITVDRLKFEYEDESHDAEEWITDEQALNKDKTKLVKRVSKFRRHTIDYMQKFFEDAATALGQAPKAAVKTSAVLPTTQVVTQNPVTEAKVQTATTPTVPVVAVQPSIKTSSNELAGFSSIDPQKIPGNIIKLLEVDWMLVTAGDDKEFNMMTASWGGLGRLYEKPTTTSFIYPTRFTYQLMERGDYYTLSFYTEAYREQLKYCGSNTGKDTNKVEATGLTPITTPNGAKAFAEAWLIIECKKMVSQTLTPEALIDDDLKEEWIGKQLHKMYIGEITNVWMK